MNQSPDPFNGRSPANHFLENDNGFQNLSSERMAEVRKEANKWFAILLIVGLSLGGLLAVGVVKALNELGLTERPGRPLRIEMQQ